MFKETYIKLTGVYLTIIMMISIFFSANIYVLSIQELDRGLRSIGPTITIQDDYSLPNSLRTQIEKQRVASYQHAKARVINRLLLINLVILVGGGLLSYYLARKTLQPIEEAHEAQSRFTADASHELRTPLAAMRTEIEVALMDPKLSLAKAKTLLQSNLEELAKLTDLSEGLLRLAQMENHELEKQELTMNTIAENAIGRVLAQAEKKNILIDSKVGAQKIVGDESSLTEAVVILLDNAIKYSPEKTQVQVTSKKTREGVEIAIKDHGIGIKATELPHIFDRFYRADTARSKQQIHGYGIGLAIAKNIVDLHEGKLDVTSKPGKGSTFAITLPAK